MKTFTTAILVAGAIAVQLNEPNPNEGPKRAYYADSVTRSTNPFNFTRLVRNPHSDDWESKFGYQEFPEVFNQQVITYHRTPKARPDYVKTEEKAVTPFQHVVTLTDPITTTDPYPNWGPWLGNTGSTRGGPFDGRFNLYDASA